MEIPVEVGISPTLGIRGLIATRDIAEGEVIERSPLILFPIEQEALIEASALSNYYYLWNETHYAIALGYGSLYNHAYHANVRYERDYVAQVIVHTAAKPIRQGEELTMNYNGSPDDETPLDPAKWW